MQLNYTQLSFQETVSNHWFSNIFIRLIGGTQRSTTTLGRVDLEVVAIKGYFTFTSAQELEPKHQTQFSIILRTPCFWLLVTPLQGWEGILLEVGQTGFFSLSYPTSLGEGKLWIQSS